MNWYYKPYVSVAERREEARKKIAVMKKKGMEIFPLEVHSKKIATTFWGRSWCSHIETFSDFDNRLPKGRSYVRNGSVCHLEIESGVVNAMVSGSELYDVKINIKPISQNKWKKIKASCGGKINSILDLLSGKLSDGVMDIVCDQRTGLFPLSKDIDLSCSCPDWATMCKHIAAVLYGVGARLDSQPEELFKLRAVNYEELIDVSQAVSDIIRTRTSKSKRLSNTNVSRLFDIELSDDKETLSEKNKNKKKTAVSNNVRQKMPKAITGYAVRKQRKTLGLSKSALAKQLKVSLTSIYNWENCKRKKVTASKKSMEKLCKLWLGL